MIHHSLYAALSLTARLETAALELPWSEQQLLPALSASLLSAASGLNVFQELHVNVCFSGEGFHLGCKLFGGQPRLCFRVLQDIVQFAKDTNQAVSSAGTAP